jgi:hypothetical protein
VLAFWLVHPPAQPRLLVGVDDDSLKWTPHPLEVVRRQQALGAQAVRVWVPWHGDAHPSAVRRIELARAELAARHTRVVLAVFGFARDTPRTPGAQRRFCAYAATTLALVPHAHAVVVWNEANSSVYWDGTAAEYAELLARCYDRLHRHDVTVLSSTASAHAPEAFLRALGRAARGRRLVDAFGHNPYPRAPTEAPGARHAVGFAGQGDYRRLAATLRRAFGGTPEVWYLETGLQSSVPRRLQDNYTGRENASVVSSQAQARYLRRAIRLAACQPGVRAFFNFELVDEDRLAGWQSGLLWRGARPKPAAAAFAEAAGLARSGCP